jgi:hypothetical protein
MKPKIFMVSDTETTGLGSRAFVFDFAYVIATKKTILCERQFCVREIITNPKLMLTAFFNPDWRTMFGGKIFSLYIPNLADHTFRIYPWREILKIMRDDILTYGVDVFCAYNIEFDLGALNKTHRWIAEKNLNFSRLDLLDLYLFSTSTLLNSRLYHEFAWKHGAEKGFITPAHNVRTTAQATYAFLTGNPDFIESHTALADAQIETEILWRLLARKKTIPYNDIQYMPWRHAQKIRGELLD